MKVPIRQTLVKLIGKGDHPGGCKGHNANNKRRCDVPMSCKWKLKCSAKHMYSNCQTDSPGSNIGNVVVPRASNSVTKHQPHPRALAWTRKHDVACACVSPIQQQIEKSRPLTQIAIFQETMFATWLSPCCWTTSQSTKHCSEHRK